MECEPKHTKSYDFSLTRDAVNAAASAVCLGEYISLRDFIGGLLTKIRARCLDKAQCVRRAGIGKRH